MFIASMSHELKTPLSFIIGFTTATYTDKKDEEFVLSLGAEKFIRKPAELKVFLNILKEVIEKHKKDRLIALKEPIKKEEIYLTEYSKRLIEKLEKKVFDLEKSEKKVKHLFEDVILKESPNLL